MKRNAIATVICTAVIAAAIVVPFHFNSTSDAGVAGLDPSPESSTSPSLSTQPSSGDAGNFGAIQNDDTTTVMGDDGREYKEGAVLVGLKEGITADDLNAVLPQLDYIATKQVAENDISLGYVELDLSAGTTVEEAQAQLVGEDIVAAAQPNHVYHLLDSGAVNTNKAGKLTTTAVTQATYPSDPYRTSQWALKKVNAYDAWDTTKTSQDVTVAVLDDGFLTTHEDLENNIVGTYNAVYDREDVTPSGHGTHVCGIIAAEANNSVGVTGVSYNAGLLPIQVFDGKEADDDDIVRAYDYVIKNAAEYKIKVINMSLGATLYGWTLQDIADDLKQGDALTAAINKAYNAGILTVCAAGNDADVYGAYANHPSDWASCALGVIATTNTTNNSRAYYSNYNLAGQTTKDISAPGGNDNNSPNTGILSTYSDNASAYGTLYGTSMATPYVSGIAALVFATCPNLTPAQVTNIIHNTAIDLNTAGWDRETGYGLIDANAAVKAAKTVYDTGTSTALVTKTIITGATVTPTAASYAYTGSQIIPSFTVKVGGRTLVQNTDYQVTCTNNVNVGIGRATIIGKGNYTGTASASFTIIPKGTKVAKVTAAKKGFTVKWKKQAAQTSGYQVQYSLKSNFSSKNKTVTIGKNTTVSKKIKKLKAKKKYYVRVRTYKTVSGVKYYSAWSAKKAVKTKA